MNKSSFRYLDELTLLEMNKDAILKEINYLYSSTSFKLVMEKSGYFKLNKNFIFRRASYGEGIELISPSDNNIGEINVDSIKKNILEKVNDMVIYKGSLDELNNSSKHLYKAVVDKNYQIIIGSNIIEGFTADFIKAHLFVQGYGGVIRRDVTKVDDKYILDAVPVIKLGFNPVKQ